jgi:hypothetical protein
MSVKKEFLRGMAQEVRCWAEDEDLRWGERPGLQGLCGIASGEFSRRLVKEGIDHEICMASDDDIGSHVFVIIDDFIYDVTATQFPEYKDQKVLIIHSREAEINWYHQPWEYFKTSKELRKFQIKNRWPEDQTAYAA